MKLPHKHSSEASDMLEFNYIEKVMGMQGITIKNIEEESEKIIISLEIERKKCVCPMCGKETDKIHDYRRQPVKELPAFGKAVTLLRRKRRYRCECGKRFFEKIPFLTRYGRMTKRMTLEIIEKLAEVRSYSSTAREFGVSASTVIRIFGNVSYPKPDKLPEALGIDEFKGNSGKRKFHCILTDLTNGRVIDIIKTRYENDLIDYFKPYGREGREAVKYFVSDMCKTYTEIAKYYFPQATYIIDKYHWIRQAVWAFEAVRKEIQKRFSKSHRIYFKNSRKLLIKREKSLTEDELRQVNIMLYASADLSTAYFLKEQLYDVLTEADGAAREAAFKRWIENAMDSGLAAFESAVKHTPIGSVR